MKRATLVGIVSLFVFLGGCANQAVIAEKRAAFQNSIPKCYSEKECELMWSAARRWVLNNAGQKFQHVTDDFIETYNPPQNSPRLAARVIKEPLNDGSGYKIVVSTWCNNMFGCQPDSWDAALSFNRQVSSVKPPSF